MAFTQAWNEAVPSDSQIASGYGPNLRDMRRDLRERVAAFDAGLIAARETPEAVFGDANKGVAFFATDEDILYRWDGAAWLAAGAATRYFVNSNVFSVTNPAVDTDALSVTIPAGFLTPNSVLEINVRVKQGGLLLVKFGSATIGGISVGAQSVVYYRAVLGVVSAVSQRGISFVNFSTGSSVSGEVLLFDLTENIATAIIVKSVAPNGSGTFIHDFLSVRIRR